VRITSHSNLSIFILSAIAFFLTVSSAFGQTRSQVAREAAEFLISRFSDDVAKETVSTLTKKISSYVVKYGDEAVDAIKAVGPRGFKLIDEAGENGSAVVKLLSRHGNEAVWVVSKKNGLAIFVKYGDEAVEAMIKHPGVAGQVIEELGVPAAKALKVVDGQNARRIAMMTEDGALNAAGKSEELLGVISRFGDRAADWIWKNKAGLAVVSIATAFVANPEPFIEGSVEVVKSGLEFVVRPVAEKAAGSINWNLIVLVILVAGFIVYCARFGTPWNKQNQSASYHSASRIK